MMLLITFPSSQCVPANTAFSRACVPALHFYDGSANRKLKRCQTLLYDSTKEFLAQRSQFKQAEKAWIAEKDQLLCRLAGKKLPLNVVPYCKTSGVQPSDERSVQLETTCLDDLVSTASGDVANQSTRKRYEQLAQTVRDLQHQLSQQQKLSEMY
ncbi:unnamed protein product, partial [Dicrocoelium dendriticum]